MPKGSLAIVTGASSGIGYELAKCCVKDGFDLLIASDEDRIEQAADNLRGFGTDVRALKADLATLEGVDQLLPHAATGRSMHFLPMPAAGLAGASSIKTSRISPAWSTPISRVRFISFTVSAKTCGPPEAGAS